ncbi:contractile injection system protein, VgrG/Pvc8 family [Paenibacillus durus]|uniref:contractile injection system protein, VgrG/Pvc8 family n=1 Tax=Paenibacillus durus TaxID=44251 RepID=UPI00069361F5|nr:contractile injection system protein, VgrG/Pvc8 family [Paenibacillus durus]
MATLHTWKGYGQIKLIAPYEIQRLRQLEIRRSVGEHATLSLSAILPEEQRDLAAQQKVEEEAVEIQEVNADGEKVRTLFHGRVEQMEIETVRGMFELKLQAVSHSSLLDRKVEIRSFQLGNQSTGELIERVVLGYDGADLIDNATGADQPDALVLQYRETDWEFIKRLASRVGAVIIPESSAEAPKLWIGVPDGGMEELPSETSFTVGRDLAAYARAQAAGLEANVMDFTYYEVESAKWLQLGDNVTFRGKELAVAAAVSQLTDGAFRHTYTLRLEAGIRQPFILNERITGVSLDGKVIDLQKDRVRVHLDIDASQEKSEAVWIPYESVYSAEGSSGLYLMPKAGDAVQVYFPSAREEEAMARGSVRKSGQPSPKLEDPGTKYWGTDYGKELKFGASDLSLTATEGSLFISLEDSSGITIQSDTGIVLSAKKDLEWTSEKKIEITAQEGIYLLSGNSSVVMDGSTDIRGDEVELAGLTKAPVTIEDLEPQPEAPFVTETQPEEEKPKKKGFWSKFLDVTQVVLDVAGCIPVIGEVADVANAGISLARGDYMGAALSMASAIPFAGWAAAGAKIARDAMKAGSMLAKATDKVVSVAKAAKEVAQSMTSTGTLGKVFTGARNLGSNLSQSDVLQKMQKMMQRLEMNSPKLSYALDMAGQTARNYMKSEAQERAVQKVQEEGWAPREVFTLLGILTNTGGKRHGWGGGDGSHLGAVSGGGSGRSGDGRKGNAETGKPQKQKKHQAEKKSTPQSGNGPYSHLTDSKHVGPGKDFTAAQKKKIIEENMKQNGRGVKSDQTGQILTKPQKSKKGVTPDPNEWQIDHIIPRDKGGTNSYSNAQVLSRKENREKSNKLPSDFDKPSKKTPPTKPKRRKK